MTMTAEDKAGLVAFLLGLLALAFFCVFISAAHDASKLHRVVCTMELDRAASKVDSLEVYYRDDKCWAYQRTDQLPQRRFR